MWLAVAGPDVERALAAMEASWLGRLPEETRGSAEASVDLESDERVCPACAHSYAAGPVRCPSCGLNLGA